MAIQTDNDPDSKIQQQYESNKGSYGTHDEIGLKAREAAAIDQMEAGLRENNLADPTQENANIAAVNNREQASQTPKASWKNSVGTGGKNKKSRRVWFKKAAPTGGVIGLLVGGMIGFSALNPAGLLFVFVKEVVTNYGSAASRAAPNQFKESLYYRLSARGIESACNSKPSGIKCKRGTMKDHNVEKLISAGFDVDSRNINGRHVIKSIAKDGVRIDNSRSSLNRAMSNPAFSSSMYSAINPKSLVFLGDRFTSRVLTKLGLNKSKVTLAGDTDEERKESFTESVGGDKTAEEHTRDFEDKHKSKIDSAAKISGKGIGKTAGISCAGFNIARSVIGALKLYNAARLAVFAMQFLKVADQIKSEGDVDPETLSTMGAILTSYKTSGPEKGLTATDSQGFKVAAYGGERELASFTRRYMLSGNEKLLFLEDSIEDVQETAGGQGRVRAYCKVATSPWTNLAGLAASCGTGGGPGATIGATVGSVVPGLGTAVGGVVGAFGGCIAVIFSADYIINKIVEGLLSAIIPKVVETLTEAPIGSDIVGVDAGNALAAGAGVILELTNRSRGMQLATKEAVVDFLSRTAESERQEARIAEYDARKEPFNVYNQYSFLGSLVRKSGIIGRPTSSATDIFSLSASLLQSSAAIVPKASAAASMPVNITEEDLSHCPDKTLRDIGVDCDVTGGTQYVMRADISMEENLNFMVGTHVDEDGNESSDDYKNWVDYCTDERTDPPGVDSGPIENENDWKTGEACVYKGSEISQTTRDHFSDYYYDQAASEDEDTEPRSTSGLNSAAGGSFRAATFNILHDGSKPHERNWKERLPRSIGTLTSNNVDIAGLQEVRPVQIAEFMRNNDRGDYKNNQGETIKFGIYPKTSRKPGFSPNPIIWDSDKFELIEGSTHEIRYFNNETPDHMVLVKLRVKETGQVIYFGNTHDPRLKPPVTRLDRRENAKEVYKKLFEKAADEGIPMFLTGDFNSNSDGYCILSGVGTGIINAYDASRNPPTQGRCPSKSKVKIDHIYLTNDEAISASGFQRLDAEYTHQGRPAGGNNGADHPTVFVDITIEGSDTTNSSSRQFGTIGFPLKGNKSVVGNPEIFRNGTTSLSEHPYTAYDIYADPGTEVVAFASGKVTWVSTDTCGGNFVTIWNEKARLGVSYMHLSDHISMGKTVSVGDHVGTVGNDCATPHLHIDASVNKIRQPCSRGGCGEGGDYKNIGRDLFNTYQRLPE